MLILSLCLLVLCSCQDDPKPVAAGTAHLAENKPELPELYAGSCEIHTAFDSFALVKQLTFGGHYQKDCRIPGNCQGSAWTIKKPEEELALCDQPEVKRYSHEQVAKQSLVYLKQSYAQFQKATGASLPPLTVSILPLFQIIQNTFDGGVQNLWLTNNLTYSRRQKKIMIYPQDPENPQFLWESPFPIAHELAHHIEAFHLKIILRNEIGKFRRAVSEAFADLLGFYSISMADLQADHLGEFVKNRNIEVATFEGGIAKEVSPEQAQQFLNAHVPVNHGTNVDFSSLYTMAAVLTYALHQMFSHHLLANTPIARYQLTIEWLRIYHELERQSRGNEVSFFSESVRLLLTRFADKFSVSAQDEFEDMLEEKLSGVLYLDGMY